MVLEDTRGALSGLITIFTSRCAKSLVHPLCLLQIEVNSGPFAKLVIYRSRKKFSRLFVSLSVLLYSGQNLSLLGVILYCIMYLVIVCVFDVAWFHCFPWSSNIWIILCLLFELNTMAWSTIIVGDSFFLMLFQKWTHSSFAGGVLPRWLFYHVPLLESIDLGLRGSKSRLSLSLINMTSPSCAVFSCFFILRSLLAGTLFFSFFFCVIICHPAILHTVGVLWLADCQRYGFMYWWNGWVC